MGPLAALSLASSAPGAKGGGGAPSGPSFDQQIKSSAASSLDSSGSNYSQATGDFIIGGAKNSMIPLFIAAGVALFLLLKR